MFNKILLNNFVRHPPSSKFSLFSHPMVVLSGTKQTTPSSPCHATMLRLQTLLVVSAAVCSFVPTPTEVSLRCTCFRCLFVVIFLVKMGFACNAKRGRVRCRARMRKTPWQGVGVKECPYCVCWYAQHRGTKSQNERLTAWHAVKRAAMARS